MPVGSTHNLGGGYLGIKVLESGHPKKRWRALHRWVMEQHLGRALEPYEHVHHIDGDGNNNVLSNLRLVKRGQHHAQYHRGNNTFSDDELLADLRRVAQEHGPSIGWREYQRFGIASHVTIRSRFGSWNRAKQAVGLPCNPHKTGGQRIYSDAALLDELKRLKHAHGTVTVAICRKHGAANPETYQRRFGSWSNAKALAGV